MIYIKGRKVTEEDLWSPVTYVPPHADGDANHKDCERGVLVGLRQRHAVVLFCSSRTKQITDPDCLVWG